MAKDKMSNQKIEKDLELAAVKGQEMFKEMAATLLQAEPTAAGSTAIMYALSKVTACVLKSLLMTGMPVTKRFQECVLEWSLKMDNDENYSNLHPFDEYVLNLMGKRTYNKEEPIRPFDQEW